MSQNSFQDLNFTECPRDGTPTNLRCAQCDALICPNCMVYAPVGNKCPDCASIGGPGIFKVTQADIIRTGVLGGLASVAIGAFVAVVLIALWTLDFLAGTNSSIWLVLVGVANFGGVMATTFTMQRIIGVKYATSLRIMAALFALTFYVAEVVAIEAIDAILTDTAVGAELVVHLPGLIGFAFGTYYAMQRFKA